MDLKTLRGSRCGRRKPCNGQLSKERSAWALSSWGSRGEQGNGFASRVVRPLHMLSKAVWTNTARGRLDQWQERLRKVQDFRPIRISILDGQKLLKVSECILLNSRARQDGSPRFQEMERQLAESIKRLHVALASARQGYHGGLVKIVGHESKNVRVPAHVGRTMALGQAANGVVQSAAVILKFINCHGMKVSVSSDGDQTNVVVDGGGGSPNGGDKERLRKISGVSCPYVIDEKANTIKYKSSGHDERPSKTYRIPLGAASKAVNTLVKGMVDGIRSGSKDWSAPFMGDDAKALGRETRLDNQAFLKECVKRAHLKGKGNQTYANSAQLYHYGMPEP